MNPNEANGDEQPQNNKAAAENRKNQGRTIQPLNGGVGETKPANDNAGAGSKVDVSSIYPEATQEIDAPNMNSSQRFAQKLVETQTKESNRLVCMRVKSVLVIGILFVLAGIYSTLVSLNATISHGLFGLIFVGLGLVEIIMSITLLTTKNHSAASLILKIFLILQAINLVLSLTSSFALIVNGLVIIFLFYVYSRVKSLSYY